MHVQPLLATWGAEWELFGAPVWFFLALGSIAAFLVSRFSPLSAVAQGRLLPWLSPLMLLGCFFTRWIHSRSASFLGDWYFYKFYFARLDAAFIICFAFGVAFTVDSLRRQEQLCRIVGYCVAPIYTVLLVATVYYILGWYEFGRDAG